MLELSEAVLVAGSNDVSGVEAARDLERTLYLFQQAYAGELELDRAEIEKTRARLLASDVWSPSAYAAELARLFDTRDGHVGFDYGGPTPIRTAQSQALAADFGHWLPEGPGAPPSHHASTWQASEAEATTPGAPVELFPGAVPVLAIRTFDNRAESTLRDLPGLARRLRRAPGFVVDLRGNGGGNFAFAEAFVLELAAGELERLDEAEVMSVAAIEGRLNTARYEIARGNVGDDVRPHYDRHIDALTGLLRRAREADQGRVEIERTGKTVQGRAETSYAGRIVLLADDGCASACEMMIALARQLPNTILVGDATRGAMEVGEVATFRLPSSGVTVRFGTRRYDDPRGKFEEARGFEPDVRVEGADALLHAMRLAQQGR